MGLFDLFKKKNKDAEEKNTEQESGAGEQTEQLEQSEDGADAGTNEDTQPDEKEENPVSEVHEEAAGAENAQGQAASKGMENEQEDLPVDNDSAVSAAESDPANSEEASDVEPEPQEKKEKKPGFFKRLVDGLTKTRNQLTESLNQIFKGHSELDDDFYEELEEVLIMADLGLETTDNIIADLKKRVKEYKIKEVEPCRELLNNIIRDQMMVDDSAYDFEEQKTVMLIIGVNGVGKTTSIGKLAAQYKSRGKKVLMAAGDTFRAAAIDQLKTWAERAGVEIIAQQEGSDPAAVVYDAVQAAKARDVDILLCDTAGRLHNKKNLMDELAKMRRIIEKEYPAAHCETLIVLDGSTGQNALEQARQFSEVTDLNGIILTKLDGTAKGGIAIAIQSELNVPVKYIGVGEHAEDLQLQGPAAGILLVLAPGQLLGPVAGKRADHGRPSSPCVLCVQYTINILKEKD